MTVTDKQASYIKTLFEARKETLRKPEYVHILQMEMATKHQASALINALLRVPRDPQPVIEPTFEVGEGVYKIDDKYVVLQHHPDYGLVGKYWNGYKFVRLIRAKRQVIERGRPATEAELYSLSSMVGAIGKSTSTCQFCMRPLSDGADGHSIDRGYGPVCAQRYGLPWGVDTASSVSS